MISGTAGSTQRLRLQRRRKGMPQLRYPQPDLDDRFTSTPAVRGAGPSDLHDRRGSGGGSRFRRRLPAVAHATARQVRETGAISGLPVERTSSAVLLLTLR